MASEAVGDGSALVAPRYLLGPHHIVVGRDVRIFPGVWLAAEPSTWTAQEPAVTIGDRCLLRDDVVVSATEKIVLEADVAVAGRVTIIDSDHTWVNGNALVANNESVTGPIRIGRGTWIAEQSIVLRDTDIGAFCIVAANSVVRGHFPDFSVIAGAPAVVVGSTWDRVPPHLRACVGHEREET